MLLCAHCLRSPHPCLIIAICAGRGAAGRDCTGAGGCAAGRCHRYGSAGGLKSQCKSTYLTATVACGRLRAMLACFSRPLSRPLGTGCVQRGLFAVLCKSWHSLTCSPLPPTLPLFRRLAGHAAADRQQLARAAPGGAPPRRLGLLLPPAGRGCQACGWLCIMLVGTCRRGCCLTIWPDAVLAAAAITCCWRFCRSRAVQAAGTHAGCRLPAAHLQCHSLPLQRPHTWSCAQPAFLCSSRASWTRPGTPVWMPVSILIPLDVQQPAWLLRQNNEHLVDEQPVPPSVTLCALAPLASASIWLARPFGGACPPSP